MIVGDRDAVWRWDPAGNARSKLTSQVYWPRAIALHERRLLVDAHGHGAAVVTGTPSSGESTIALGDGRVASTGEVGWLGDSAVVVGSPEAFTSTGAAAAFERGESVDADVVAPWADGADALLCWRRELAGAGQGRLHRLYQTARGVEICRMIARGDTIAWIEADRAAESCETATHRALVVATLRGACE